MTPNFSFDPPVALQQASAIVTPTVPAQASTTPASPSPTVASPQPTDTGEASSQITAPAQGTRSQQSVETSTALAAATVETSAAVESTSGPPAAASEASTAGDQKTTQGSPTNSGNDGLQASAVQKTPASDPAAGSDPAIGTSVALSNQDPAQVPLTSANVAAAIASVLGLSQSAEKTAGGAIEASGSQRSPTVLQDGDLNIAVFAVPTGSQTENAPNPEKSRTPTPRRVQCHRIS